MQTIVAMNRENTAQYHAFSLPLSLADLTREHGLSMSDHATVSILNENDEAINKNRITSERRKGVPVEGEPTVVFAFLQNESIR